MPRQSTPRQSTPRQSRRPPPAVDLVVEAGKWPSRAKLRRIAVAAVEAASAAARLRSVAGAEVTVLFTDDAHIRVLNRRYRKKNKPTNVLSFPAPRAANGEFAPLLGDVVLAAETLAREAAEMGIATDDHLTHLIVHGFLHLIGYDHEDDTEAAAMETLETRILKTLGVADPYAPLPEKGPETPPKTRAQTRTRRAR